MSGDIELKSSFRFIDSYRDGDRSSSAVANLLDVALEAPLRELFSRPSKHIRADLVAVGYALAGAREEHEPASRLEAVRIATLADALEAIHVGSLIVDDIQDGSVTRRGGPCLHRVYGIPLALNAGNSLYFWPLEQIRSLDLPESLELKLYRLFHEALFRAHLGQALDLGASIDSIPQDGVRAVCSQALELKTGELMALALGAGAALGGAEPERLSDLLAFGRRFGVALQMHDDIGNVFLSKEEPKRLEDLRLRRPSWAWAEAATLVEKDGYFDFVRCVRELSENEDPLQKWLAEHRFQERARKNAKAELDATVRSLRVSLGINPDTALRSTSRFPRALRAIDSAADRIATAYGG